MKIFRESTRKWRSFDSKIQALTAKETTSKAHMQVHTNKESREKQPGKKPGPNRAETGLGRPAWADRLGPTGPSRSGPRSIPPLTELPLELFIAPWPKATKRYIRHPPLRSRVKKYTVPERRGSRWLTRVPLAGVGTLHGRPCQSSRS
jgi:hypothetical protein